MKVLILEDYLLVAWALRLLVVETDPKIQVVGIATNPERALALARIHEPDLALVDIRLENNTSGVVAAQQLFEKFGVHSVYVTAYRNDAKPVPGVLGVLVKPYNAMDIHTVLQVAGDVLAGRPPGPLSNSFILFPDSNGSVQDELAG
jgi:DNA-binding NarL/FixJ family response regulator